MESGNKEVFPKTDSRESDKTIEERRHAFVQAWIDDGDQKKLNMEEAKIVDIHRRECPECDMVFRAAQDLVVGTFIKDDVFRALLEQNSSEERKRG
jgi:hypothetical protein